MKLENIIQETVEDLLKKIEAKGIKVNVSMEDDNIYRVNIETEEPSTLIGYHGENIQALQQIAKILCWKKCSDENFSVIIDVDNYRKRQEENVINLAERKVEMVRKMKKSMPLPPMSPYFRRIVHMHLMQPEFSDVETASNGENEMRHIIIQLK